MVNRSYTLETALQLDDVVTNGVATTADSRMFLVFPRMDGSSGPRIVERVSGTFVPYPDDAWNRWAPNSPAESAFVRANSLRIGPDGLLWIVDVGAPAFGNAVAGGPKLVSVDLATNRIARVYSLETATKDRSFIDDVRFNGRKAYVTDAGAPGIIVVDLDTGDAWRALDGHESVTALEPMTAENEVLQGPDGKPVYIHADQLEVSPDRRWLYFQPCCGSLSRIETRWLDRRSTSDEERAKHVQYIAPTPSTGGTAIDDNGNIYVSDTDNQRIFRVTPDGDMSVLIEDARLLWVDAMWLDRSGYLWMPAAQLNRIAPFQNGTSKVEYPLYVYKVQIDQTPPASDHV